MATTVKQLIESLQTLDQDEAILFQYLVAEHTEYNKANFAKLVGYLEDSTDFGDDTSEQFTEWLVECEDILFEEKDEDDE